MTDENKRTETARDHDDSRIIDAAQKDALGAGVEQSRAGGEKQTAVGTRAEAKRVDEPEASTGVDKGDDRADTKPNESAAT